MKILNYLKQVGVLINKTKVANFDDYVMIDLLKHKNNEIYDISIKFATPEISKIRKIYTPLGQRYSEYPLLMDTDSDKNEFFRGLLLLMDVEKSAVNNVIRFMSEQLQNNKYKLVNTHLPYVSGAEFIYR